MKKRIIIYLTGMIVLALGITLNTRTGLGVTPIIAPPFSVQEITGGKLGNIVFAWYSIFLLYEMWIHFRMGVLKTSKQIGSDLLQLPVSLLFTRLMNLYSSILPDFASDFDGMFWGSITGRLVLIVIAVILTGTGAAMTMDARLVPNPADGLVQALGDYSCRNLGLVRNLFDLTCVIIACIVSLVGRGVLTHGIGIGTLIAALGAGRVIAVYHLLLDRISGAKNTIEESES